MVNFVLTNRTNVRINSPVDSDCQLKQRRSGGLMSSTPNTPSPLFQIDECQPPPDAKDLADKSPHGLNVDGAICLTSNACESSQVYDHRLWNALTDDGYSKVG